MIDKNKLHLIEWVDSNSMYGGRWQDIDDIGPLESMVCYSVGFIIKETKDSIMVAPHISDVKNKEDVGMLCGEMVIPVIAIIKRIKLKIG